MNEEELKRLIEKYYSGESTEEEERALRAYFIENSAPPGYEAEKEIFSFLMEAGEVPEPSAGFEARIIKAVDTSDKKELIFEVQKNSCSIDRHCCRIAYSGRFIFLFCEQD